MLSMLRFISIALCASLSFSFLPKLTRTNSKIFHTLSMQDSDDVYDPDFNNRVKLKEEIAFPFRKLRYFFYASAVSGGGLGFITTLPQAIIAFQDHSDKLTTVLTNLGVDAGGVIGGALLWYREYKDEQVKLERFTQAEMKLTNRLDGKAKSDREKKLARLPVEIQFSMTDNNETRIVSFKDLQDKGQQNIVIFAGSKSIVRDAVISARLEGNDFFNGENIMLIPLVLEDDQLEANNNGKGFASKDSIMTAPYIAKPAQVNVWERDIQEEVQAAIKQGSTDIINQGLVLMVNMNGIVVRRGVGIPPWKSLPTEFKPTKSPTK